MAEDGEQPEDGLQLVVIELSLSRTAQPATTQVVERGLSDRDRIVVKLIALGIVAMGFAAALVAPWYVKPFGVPTVLLGIAVFAYPDPVDHLRLYSRILGGTDNRACRCVGRAGLLGDPLPPTEQRSPQR